MDFKNICLSIVRLGIGQENGMSYNDHDYSCANWKEIDSFLGKHGLSAVLVDGIERIPVPMRPPKAVVLQWIGETLQGYEYRYELYCRAMADMAAWYNSHGFKMMVLKGYACGLNWPRPEHRPCGDIDIWLFGKQKEADGILSVEKGVKIDKGHHHHTIFYWRDFMIENHYDFDNIYAHSSNLKIERVFKELGKDDSYSVEVYGEKVYLPSPNLSALFLIRHMVSHFAASEITLRQVLDWAFFVVKHTKEVDWNWLLSLLDQYHMKEFFNCINAICVEDLGFSSAIFPCVQFSPSLKDKVLADILDPEFTADEPKGFVHRMAYKYRRWQGNAWKQRLCYNESRWSMFWTGIWAKLIKPSSI